MEGGDGRPRAEYPVGTVTFLFTDIEGSTKHLRELRDAYARVLEDHGRLIREQIEQAGGVVVDTQGDSFLAAFRHADDADAWEANFWDHNIWRVGLDGRPTVTVQLGQGSASGLALDKERRALWAIDPEGREVLRIDTEDGSIDQRIALTDAAPSAIAVTADAVWVTTYAES